MDTGYIYVRETYAYKIYNAVKLGHTKNLYDRNMTYKVGEIISGKFILVFEVYMESVIVETILQNELIEYHIKYDGGNEFYDNIIVYMIENIFIKKKIQYKKLTNNKINYMVKYKEINDMVVIKPTYLQYDTILKIKEYYKLNNIGKIIWACGLGKTLLSLFTIKELGYKKNCICVPYIHLINYFKAGILTLYPDKNINIHIVNNTNYTTEDIKNIINEKISNPIFIITTYTSCNKLINNNIIFDIKIGDEAHHLIGLDNDNTYKHKYTHFHKIHSLKTLHMTATEKIIDMVNEKIIDMNDKELFGNIIDYKSVKWSIDNNYIVDYNILILQNTYIEINSIIQQCDETISNIDLLISAYMSLYAIYINKNITHMLIYTNSKKNANLVKYYIDLILKKKIIELPLCLYNKALYSENKLNIENEINDFKNSAIGIISCIYLFGEGIDIPKLNAVSFAENMFSIIRIIQSILRANRLDKNNKHKKAYVILPYIDTEKFNIENNSYKKIKNILMVLRNEDEAIENKIKLIIPNNKLYNNNTHINEHDEKINNEEQLKKIKLRLILSKQFKTNKDEYDYCKIINKQMNIKTKTDYINSKENHEYYIEDPNLYFEKWINWYDFFDINTNEYIPTKKEWITFCKSINISSVDDYRNKANLYSQLSPEPSYLYNNFTNIIYELCLLDNVRR